MRVASILTILMSLMSAMTDVQAADNHWPRFRGPNGSGIGKANIPADWDSAIAWKVATKGFGHSSPVVWGEKVFLTAADQDSNDRLVQCYDVEEGELLWQRSFPGSSYKMHKRNSPATSTPALDSERIYTLWATPEQFLVIALTHDGKDAWTADLGKFQGGHGFAVSPIRYGELLIIPNDQDKGGSVIALDAKTGKRRWESPRRGQRATYSTPCVLTYDGNDSLIFTNWQHGVTAIDPTNGKVRWERSTFDTAVTQRSVSSPIVAGETVLATCGFVTGKKRFVAIKPDSEGQPEETWRLEREVAYLPTPLVKDGLVFLCSEKGIATCLKADTGEQLWQERIGGNYYASPVCAGDKLFCLSDEGTMNVLAASDSFAHLGRIRLDEPTQATPAIAAGRMFVRTERHLIGVMGSE